MSLECPLPCQSGVDWGYWLTLNCRCLNFSTQDPLNPQNFRPQHIKFSSIHILPDLFLLLSMGISYWQWLKKTLRKISICTKGNNHKIILFLYFLHLLILSLTKFLIMIGYRHAYLSHNWQAITWVPNCRFPIWTLHNCINVIVYPHDSHFFLQFSKLMKSVNYRRFRVKEILFLFYCKICYRYD